MADVKYFSTALIFKAHVAAFKVSLPSFARLARAFPKDALLLVPLQGDPQASKYNCLQVKSEIYKPNLRVYTLTTETFPAPSCSSHWMMASQVRLEQIARLYCSSWSMHWQTSCEECLPLTTKLWPSSWWGIWEVLRPLCLARGNDARLVLCQNMMVQMHLSYATRQGIP